MKKTVIKSLQKLFSREKTFLKTKDTVFCNPSEHLYRANAYIRNYYKGKMSLPILDIGAADGGSAHYFSSQFRNSTVYAFEPIRSMYDIACKTNAGNTRVVLKNIALLDKIGSATINITQNKLSSSLHKLSSSELDKESNAQKDKFEVTNIENIKTSTLDEECKNLEEILMIKLDTQGTELTILQNGMKALGKTHLLLIEMNNNQLYENGCQYFEVDEFVRSKNFRLVDIIVTYRAGGIMKEYDALYENQKPN